MTTRTQYLIFISIWVAACIIGILIAIDLGISFGDNSRSMRGTFIAISVIALLPAVVGYALIQRLGSIVNKWRVRRGHDIYKEREFEDEGGFIHLLEVPEGQKEHNLGVREMVSDVESVMDDLSSDNKDSE